MLVGPLIVLNQLVSELDAKQQPLSLMGLNKLINLIKDDADGALLTHHRDLLLKVVNNDLAVLYALYRKKELALHELEMGQNTTSDYNELATIFVLIDDEATAIELLTSPNNKNPNYELVIETANKAEKFGIALRLLEESAASTLSSCLIAGSSNDVAGAPKLLLTPSPKGIVLNATFEEIGPAIKRLTKRTSQLSYK